ncbi:MAG: DUF721 domain-containing protein [Acidimicrobiales bacterium]|nr:DUF721 domain-containing protein [Acidimicrobiales bacterium]
MPWTPLPDPNGPPPTNLGDVLPLVVEGLGAPSVDVLVLVHERWPEVVGEEVAGHARPLGIDGSTLKVAAESPTWASHIRWSEAEIVARLSVLLGRDEVSSVAVRVARN